MESRAFIKQAATLIDKLNKEVASDTLPDEATQKEVSQLFSGLQNPTLPSAYRLRDAATAAGYTVSQAVLQRLAQFENLT